MNYFNADEHKCYPKAKVYSDGSHYIGIPQEHYPHGKGCKKRSIAVLSPQQFEKKERFETAYKESQNLPKRERKKYISEQLKGDFETAEQAKEFVEQNIERKKNNLSKRRVRLWRKIYLQTWNYFATFTFDDKKHTEESFRKSLYNTLKRLAHRKGWKYIGAWEYSPDKQRLHFHGIFYIPENAMIGELTTVSDYSTKNRRKQTTCQNSHFLSRFGRNDFKEINRHEVKSTVKYLLKYIEKTGEKLVFGGKLPTFFVSDLMDEDIICGFGVEERKVILADEFNCWDEGCLIGKVSPEVIEQMPKAN